MLLQPDQLRPKAAGQHLPLIIGPRLSAERTKLNAEPTRSGSATRSRDSRRSANRRRSGRHLRIA
jgi:hypothetical protein